MSDMGILETKRPEFDGLLTKIIKYADGFEITSDLALETARYCLMDTVDYGLLAPKYPACTKLLGPSVEGAEFRPSGVRALGTSYRLESIREAFNVGTMVRWFGSNDTWLVAEWGHPSDNLDTIWAVADHVSRENISEGKEFSKVKCILRVMIKAHEIQGVLALENCFNKAGVDHILLVRIASTAVAAKFLGRDFEEIRNAISRTFIDDGALRTCHHTPNIGSRKNWAADGASSRGVDLALKAETGKMGYSSVLSARSRDYEDVKMRRQKLTIPQEFDSYIMENILFKISFPVEFHTQAAVEVALVLHDEVKDRLDQIEKIVVATQESEHRTISKVDELANPVDRSRCIQYMAAMPLISGCLDTNDYEDSVASDKRIDTLRAKMQVEMDDRYTKEYLESDRRSVANAVQVLFKDGTSTRKVEVKHPIGHKRYGSEGIPLSIAKFRTNLATRLSPKQYEKTVKICKDQKGLEQMNFNEFGDLF